MKRRIATAPAWIALALTAFLLPILTQATEPEAVFSVETNQYGTAADGATVLQEGVYDSRGGIHPFVESFVSGFLGLNGVAVDAGQIYFSVTNRGQQFFAGGLTMLEANCGYRYDPSSGTLAPLDDWSSRGITLGDLDALDVLWDGSVAFSTEDSQQILQNGRTFAILNQNVYRFDPLSGTFGLFFDGAARGLTDLDAVDVLASGRVVFSTARNRFVLTPQGGIVLRHQNAYLARDAGNVALMVDGIGLGLNTLDAIDVDLMMLAVDGDLVHWSALTTSSGSFDLVRGDLFELAHSPGDFSSSTRECLAAGQEAKSVLYPHDPDPGSGFWFVMRETGSTYDSAGPAQVGSRDPGIAASGAGCP